MFIMERVQIYHSSLSMNLRSRSRKEMEKRNLQHVCTTITIHEVFTKREIFQR